MTSFLEAFSALAREFPVTIAVTVSRQHVIIVMLNRFVALFAQLAAQAMRFLDVMLVVCEERFSGSDDSTASALDSRQAVVNCFGVDR